MKKTKSKIEITTVNTVDKKWTPIVIFKTKDGIKATVNGEWKA